METTVYRNELLLFCVHAHSTVVQTTNLVLSYYNRNKAKSTRALQLGTLWKMPATSVKYLFNVLLN